MVTSTPTFCPVCGHTLTMAEIGGRTRPKCDACGYVHFVNPVPGVGMLIEMDDGLVLIRRGHAPHKGRWTLPSGFVEVDESAEEAAVREAEEETGLKTEIIELAAVNSFPEGPPTSGIMIFYRMKPVGGTLQAGDDASAVKVFPRDDLPKIPFRTHREMVADWLTWQGGSVTHPPAPHMVVEHDFRIRPADITDLNEVGALLQLIPANRDIPYEKWLQIFQRFRDIDGLDILVAESTQKPPILIGMVSLSVARTLTTEGALLINDMAVLPQFQRRGVGAALIEASMKRAQQLNLNTLYVNVQRANEQARAFYRASGFADAELCQLKIR